MYARRAHRLPRGRNFQKFSFMRPVKGEPVHYLLAVGDDVVNVHQHVWKALQQIRVVITQTGHTRTDTTGKSVMDHRRRIELEVAFQVPGLEAKRSPLQSLNIVDP